MGQGTEKEPEGTVGEYGYKEYDEADFADDAADEAAETSADEKSKGDTKDSQTAKTEEPAAAGKTEATDDTDGAGGEGDDGEGEGSGTSKETAAGDDKQADYTPNFKYRVYDQEKEFDPKLQKLITDKESETAIRDLVTKAEGLDVLKPTHQRIVQERDEVRGQRDVLHANATRIMGLRDTNRRLFFAELGVTDEQIVQSAREIVNAKDPENPQLWNQFQQMRDAEWRAHQATHQAQHAQSQVNNGAVQAHEQAMSRALTVPHIATFAEKYDGIHKKAGAFREAVEARGNYLYHQRGYVDPAVVAEDVYQSQLLVMGGNQPPATQQTPPAGGSTGSGGEPAVRQRPKSLPNVGRGRNASPVGKKPRNLKELKEAANRELKAMDR